MSLEIELDQYIQGRRASVKERELAHRLRQLPEEERFQLIWNLIQHSHIGLLFAKQCIRETKHFQTILERGLDVADASSIQWWLDCVVSALGVRRVLTTLKRTLTTNGLGVYKAVYYMRSVAPNMDQEALAVLREIRADTRYRQIENDLYSRAYGKFGSPGAS